MIRGSYLGMNEALLEVLSQYQPGEVGVDGIGACVIALANEEWAWWSWMEYAVSISITAGLAAQFDLYTVPLDERCWLDSIILERTTGDNDLLGVQAVWPDDYRQGGDATGSELALRLVAAPSIWWPDAGGQQGLDRSRPGPILLEPGTQIKFTTGGAGSIASTFTAEIAMRRTKLIRALPPQ